MHRLNVELYVLTELVTALQYSVGQFLPYTMPFGEAAALIADLSVDLSLFSVLSCAISANRMSTSPAQR